MKKILIALGVALLLVIGICAPAFAADPTVTITGTTPTMGSSVGGSFTGGTLSWSLNATTNSTTTTMTGITGANNLNTMTSGYSVQGVNAPGTPSNFGFGEGNGFIANGDVNATYSSTAGNYGILNSFINASGDGSLEMQDCQNFNVMGGNTNTNVSGFFDACAAGSNAQMNLKSIGSMYVWSEATNPYSAPALSGNYISKELDVSTCNDEDDVDPQTASLFLAINTDGNATMSNSNIWGWGLSNDGTATTNYAGGTRSVTATGDGGYMQTATGSSSLTFNGFNFGGGSSASLIASFVGGMSGTYSMTAK